MPESIKDAIKRWAEEGMHWPFVHDPTIGQPSVTLMFFYMGFVLANAAILASTILLLIKGDYVTATVMPTLFAAMGFVFYRMRHLDKVKIDFDDKQIELSSDDDSTDKD